MNESRASVLRVITRLNIGGPARHVGILNRDLPPAGYQSELAAGLEDPGEGSLLPDTPLIRIPSLRRSIDPRLDLKAWRSLRHLIATRRPDIVHTHLAKAGVLGRLAAIQEGVPVTVHTFHGHVFDGYFSPTRERALIAAERWISARTSALVAVSEAVRDGLLELGVGRRSQWHVIPLGLDLRRFTDDRVGRRAARDQFGLQTKGFVVGIVGRLVPIKDHATFVSAAQNIAAELPETTFVVAGDGETRTATEALIPPDLQSRFRFLGWVGDLPALYKALDVVVLTSLNEGTPVALIEASASGLPCVATAVGGVEDVVRDGRTGLLSSPRDAASIGDQVLTLLRDAQLRQQFGAAARAHVIDRFTTHQLVDRLSELYGELLAG